MNKIKTMIELLSYKQTLNKELTELQSKLKPIQENINQLNEQIFMSKELHDFLCEKILETYTESELEEVGKYRKQLHPNPWIPTETAYVSSKIFAVEIYCVIQFSKFKHFYPFNKSSFQLIIKYLLCEMFSFCR